jgi:Adenylyl/Guanylyl and SMODS C-terminal sensor domain
MTSQKTYEELLEDLVEGLQVPEGRYEAAERSYKSVGEWLSRGASSLRASSPQVYIQGSFRLGTAIRPISEDEHYDVDLVCELSVGKTGLTQFALKSAFGGEMAAYAKAYSMEPPEEGRRCWTLNYADGAQFHLDALVAIPDAARQRLLLERAGYPTDWSGTAVAITDKEHPKYRQVSEDWPHSNPKGYSNWFRSRMAAIFEARRQFLAMDARAKVEDIPEYRVRTPLQNAIQILKRHRDIMFADRPDDKPISIILTTLAAHAYQQEATIAGAISSILARMDDFIVDRGGGVLWVANPTDPAENFADRWQKYPERQQAFFEWLTQARPDFAHAAATGTRDAALDALESRLGKRLVERARAKRRAAQRGVLEKLKSGAGAAGRIILSPPHRQTPPWSPAQQGEVQIDGATVSVNGFRTKDFSSNGEALPKHASLRFEADTNVPKPYKVYWQVVNTGREAESAKGLRGGFDEGEIAPGKLTRKESTLYAGKHSIECFIVKDGLLAARSGQFIVNIN